MAVSEDSESSKRPFSAVEGDNDPEERGEQTLVISNSNDADLSLAQIRHQMMTSVLLSPRQTRPRERNANSPSKKSM